MKDDLKKKPILPDLQSESENKKINGWKVPRNGVFIDPNIIFSKAWLELPPSIAPQVYMLFLTRRTVTKDRRNKSSYIVTNSEELKIPYRTIEKLGIKASKFTRTIDILIRHGFIDISEPGNSATRQCTTYALSKRWKDYGTPAFVKHERIKCKRGGSKEPFKNRNNSTQPEANDLFVVLREHEAEQDTASVTTIRCGDCLYIGTLECKRNRRRSDSVRRRVEQLKLDESGEVCGDFQNAPS